MFSQRFTRVVLGSLGLLALSGANAQTVVPKVGAVSYLTASSPYGTLAFTASGYSVAQSGGSVQVTVTRSGGSTGKVTVNYGTTNGTAAAGVDYSMSGGTLRWARGDATSRTISIPVSNYTSFTGTKTFDVRLTSAYGGALIGTPSSTTVTITGSGSSTTTTTPPPASTATPYIQSFAPNSGPVGTVVTLNGSGFTGLTQAWVGNAHDATYTVVSDTQVRVTIPADATTGAIGLLNGTKASFSASAFTLSGGTTTTPPPPSSTSALAVRVLGGQFVDAGNNRIQLRGVNYSGYEFGPIQGWTGNDPSGAQAGQAGGPNINALKSWKVNTLRIPLNEASWLGYSCTDAGGTVHNPDPAGNYKSSVQNLVNAATAAGIYVILDLHWTAPGTMCPMLQGQMADADHSLAFWTSVANTYKSNPAVMFELFNEPFFNFDFTGDAWAYMMKGTGGSFSGYPATGSNGAWKDVKQPWAVASYQQMLDTVRATGATNVVLIGGMQYAQEFSGWLSHKPVDALNQFAAVWHPYPSFGKTWGTYEYSQPNFAPDVFNQVLAIQNAGIPVIATETGDQNSAGTVGAPLVKTITQFADQTGMSLLGWGWDVWSGPDNVLIKDVNGTPTDGYGKVFHDWMIAH
jgi:hypothetical protein